MQFSFSSLKKKKKKKKDKMFETTSGQTKLIFQTGNFLFQKFWYVPWLNYNFTILPGNMDGISGSALGGYNIGINKYINHEKKMAAATVLKFITSPEMQKKLIKDYKFLTAIPSLYDDEEVCNSIDCNSLKKVQFIVRPTSNSSDYSDYSERFRNSAFEYIFKNKDISDVVDEIEHITKPYDITLNPKNNITEFILSILIFICSIVMIISIKYIFIDKYKSNFEFLPKDFWIIYIVGAFIMMNAYYIDLGKTDITKCKFKIILLNIGIDLNLLPILYKLLINFPIENKYSKWISRNRYKFLLVFIIFNLSFICYFSTITFNINKIKMKDNRIYNICEIGKNGQIVLFILLLLKNIRLLVMFLFIFLEWNIRQTSYDIRHILSTISIDIICFIILYTIIFTKLKYNYYSVHHIIFSGILFIFALSNYIYLYLIKIIRLYISKDLKQQQNTNQQSTENENTTTNEISTTETNNNSNYSHIFIKGSNDSLSSTFQKMVEYHYKRKIEPNKSQKIAFTSSSVDSFRTSSNLS